MGGRKDKMLDVKIHDPYMKKDAYTDPTICPTCGLVYHDKMWHNNKEFVEEIKKKHNYDQKDCPACRKIKDDYPLGVLILQGSIINNTQKVTEIKNLIRHETEKEANSNPLARIFKVEEFPDRIEIKTTTEGLAKRLGNAIQKAFQGDLELVFSENDKFLRVIWKKD